MHCLITGGSGLIGRLFARHWLDAGHALTVVSRTPAKAAARLPDGCRIVDNIRKAGSVDLVVNLAGEPIADARWNAARKEQIRASRLETTETLVDWIADSQDRPAYLLSGSAVGYYGSCGDEILTERHSPGNDFSATLCRDWEALACGAESFGVTVGRLRTGIVLSRRGGALARMETPFRLGLGGAMGSGRQWMSWIHEEDIVGLILHALKNRIDGPINGGSPNPSTNAEFSRALASALHRPCLMRTPSAIVKMMFGQMGEELLLGSQRMTPQVALNSGYRFRFPDLAAAMAALYSA
ncbi:TIGR01777 family oxidoreductase [Biformimicrobium ophioploci]|uniref:TIGR01777 family oxidoreductase n=1 Tax=Biformimicrobium ophioploci TaxID=3036711 RepID=A0ABQ6LWS0_9GAMM|nr:TIGR01777 family oxidoreductase [Microbulbifer sp. NKW57]GMG86495.1 TIGR01777 family oxidoreductase [Microbulbifer sp. NKW57]